MAQSKTKRADEVIDELTYRNYVVQRKANPNKNYKRWGLIYGKDEVEAFEKRYQAALKK